MKAIHKKSGKEYTIEHPSVVDKTEGRDGDMLVLYRDENKTLYARESLEFFEKFDIVS